MIYLTIQQAADRVGVTTKTIRRWIDQGVLPASRLGPKLIRVLEEDVDSIGTPVRVTP